jgi:hypothetical protein
MHSDGQPEARWIMSRFGFLGMIFLGKPLQYFYGLCAKSGAHQHRRAGCDFSIEKESVAEERWI